MNYENQVEKPLDVLKGCRTVKDQKKAVRERGKKELEINVQMRYKNSKAQKK